VKLAFLVTGVEVEALDLLNVCPGALKPLRNDWWWIVPGDEGKTARRLVQKARKAR
jgi:hypothetical protein